MDQQNSKSIRQHPKGCKLWWWPWPLGVVHFHFMWFLMLAVTLVPSNIFGCSTSWPFWVVWWLLSQVQLLKRFGGENLSPIWIYFWYDSQLQHNGDLFLANQRDYDIPSGSRRQWQGHPIEHHTTEEPRFHLRGLHHHGRFGERFRSSTGGKLGEIFGKDGFFQVFSSAVVKGFWANFLGPVFVGR